MPPQRRRKGPPAEKKPEVRKKPQVLNDLVLAVLGIFAGLDGSRVRNSRRSVEEDPEKREERFAFLELLAKCLRIITGDQCYLLSQYEAEQISHARLAGETGRPRRTLGRLRDQYYAAIRKSFCLPTTLSSFLTCRIGAAATLARDEWRGDATTIDCKTLDPLLPPEPVFLVGRKGHVAVFFFPPTLADIAQYIQARQDILLVGGAYLGLRVDEAAKPRRWILDIVDPYSNQAAAEAAAIENGQRAYKYLHGRLAHDIDLDPPAAA